MPENVRHQNRRLAKSSARRSPGLWRLGDSPGRLAGSRFSAFASGAQALGVDGGAGQRLETDGVCCAEATSFGGWGRGSASASPVFEPR